MVKNRTYYLVNGITFYRLIAVPMLLFLVFQHQVTLFGWLLALSFFTDAIDGYLARKFKVISVAGAKLDSVADDLTILSAIIGMLVLEMEFVKSQLTLVVILISLYVIQNALALIRYHKISSFHTYSAKVAAVVQGSFLILMFLLPQPVLWLFYLAAITTIIDLVEEIVLTLVIPKWKANVKGLYWVLKKKV